MRAPIAIIALSAGLATAQTTSDLTSKDCDAANIVNACIATTGTRIQSCDNTDYDCLCSAWQDQLTCWNNCPNNDGRSGAQSYVTSYCNIVSQSSSSATTKAPKSSQTTSGSDSQTTTQSGNEDSNSSAQTTSTSTSTSSGFAGVVAVPAAGSMLAIVLGIFGMM